MLTADRKTTTKERLLRDLEEKFHAPVAFPMTRGQIEETVGKFFAFLELPQDYKDAMVAKRPTDDVSMMGYIRTKGERGEDNGKRDFKEYFHYHPEAKEAWGGEAATNPIVAQFFTAADELWQHGDRAAREVLRTLDEEFPGMHAAFFPQEKPSERILRFLKYDNRTEGKFLARAHYDRGGCTLAIAESAPGLRIGKDEATLTPVVHKEETAIFFAAPHLHQLSGKRIFPAWHDVVQASEDTVSDDAARWALVYFINAPVLPFPTSDETHVVMK